MRKKLSLVKVTGLAFLGLLLLLLFPSKVFAGTTHLDFDSGVGLLTYKIWGDGNLIEQNGRAKFTGPCVILLAEDGSPVISNGSNSVKMTLTPYSDAGTGVGVILMNANNTDEYLTAIVSIDGMVTLTDWIGNWKNVQFDYPAAANNFLTATYDTAADQATLNINDSGVPVDTVTCYNALNGAFSIYIGVCANGSGFELFEATGPSVPDYIQGAEGEGEGEGEGGCPGVNPSEVCRYSDSDCIPSGCECDSDDGVWICTMDCGGGVPCDGGGEGEGEGEPVLPWTGPGVPVAGLLGLGILAGVCALGGSRLIRKK